MGVLTDQEQNLRETVLGDLTRNGVLATLRAQLRHHVFESLSGKSNGTSDTAEKPRGLQPESRDDVVLGLVRDVLLQYHLDYTAATLTSEASMSATSDPGAQRVALAKQIGLTIDPSTTNVPLITEILKTRISGNTVRRPHVPQTTGIENPLTARARHLFDEYDANRDGAIDKEELRILFMEAFPHFPSEMVERYVTEEFRSYDVSFSGDLTFNDFLDIYSRIFVKVDGQHMKRFGSPSLKRKTAGLGTLKNKEAGAAAGGEASATGSIKDTKKERKATSPPSSARQPSATTKGALDGLEDSEIEEDSELDEDIDDLIDTFSKEDFSARSNSGKKGGSLLDVSGRDSGCMSTRSSVAINDSPRSDCKSSNLSKSSTTSKNGHQSKSIFSDSDSSTDDEGDFGLKKTSQASDTKPLRSPSSSKGEEPSDKEVAKDAEQSGDDGCDDIDESIDDDGISSHMSSEHDAGTKNSKGSSKSGAGAKDDAYGNDFEGEDDDETEADGKMTTDNDIGQDEIDAVSDISIGYSSEINETDDKSCNNSAEEDRFDYEEDADDDFVF